jgi:hypothetical protein
MSAYLRNTSLKLGYDQSLFDLGRLNNEWKDLDVDGKSLSFIQYMFFSFITIIIFIVLYSYHDYYINHKDINLLLLSLLLCI